jgi:tripeptide aminopeptidase
MFEKYKFTASERFLRYVQIDTQSDPQSRSFPSTDKQKVLSSLLVDELKANRRLRKLIWTIGDMCTPPLPPQQTKKFLLCAFVRTWIRLPDCSGANVKPIVHRNYRGDDIVLPDDPKQVLRMQDYPYLETQIGNDLITASGTTLLGADDKAGVAEIMDLANFLQNNKHIKHGEIKILFTPDEEIGKGRDPRRY